MGFDNDKFERNVGIFMVAWFLFCLVVMGVIAFVAIHFIGKYW